MIDVAENRFFVFAGAVHYANGGWHDFCGAFLSADKAVEYAESLIGTKMQKRGYDDTIEWWHVADVRENKIVAKSADEPY